MQPCQGTARRAHRDDDRQRGNQFLALLSNPIGSKDPDALKIPARRAEYSLTESASSPVQAEPRQFFIVGYQLFSEETDIYTTAPDIPVMETKQVVPVHVNHSNLRYVTEKEVEKLSYLRTTVPTVVLTLLLGSVGLLLTHRDANRNRKGKE